jgi:hypothetical protein
MFMTATLNPQTAADQARATYRAAMAQLGQLGLDTAIPEDMRALAEKTVAQSCEAYDRSKDAFEASLTAFETSFDAAGQGAAALNRKMVDIPAAMSMQPLIWPRRWRAPRASLT